MAWRIGDQIVSGELINTSRNSVHGWLDFGSDRGVRISLSGNFEGDLAGRHIRFCSTQKIRSQPSSVKDFEGLANEQVGVVGSMTLLIRRIPRGGLKDWWEQTKLGLNPPTDEKPCLYLEWFSQNGRVVAELVHPHIEYGSLEDPADCEVAPTPLPDDHWEDDGPEIIEFRKNEDGTVEIGRPPVGDDDDDDDPYRLFPDDLEQQIEESGGTSDLISLFPEESHLPSWDEVLPGISDETKKKYEQWDEVFDGDKDEPLVSLLDPPLSLRRPDDVRDESEAEMWLKTLLARLAEHGVALDICEHYSAVECYRLLVEEILPEAEIHPQLVSTGFVRHYSTWEYCEECLAELDEDEDD
jgi:hypothetical protein